MILATHAQSAESPAVLSGFAALSGAALPPLNLDYDSLSFGLVHLFAKNLSMSKSLGSDFYRKLPDTFTELQKRLGTISDFPACWLKAYQHNKEIPANRSFHPSETRGNPFSTYTPQQYGSFSRTSVTGGNSTYSGREGSGRSETLTADSKKKEEAKCEVKAPSPVKTSTSGMDVSWGFKLLWWKFTPPLNSCHLQHCKGKKH